MLQHLASIYRDGYAITDMMIYPNYVRITTEHDNGNIYFIIVRMLPDGTITYERIHNHHADFTSSWPPRDA